MATSTLTWLETDPGVWRSTDGRYAIVAHDLPENPTRTVYRLAPAPGGRVWPREVTRYCRRA